MVIFSPHPLKKLFFCSILNLREFFHSEKYRVFTQHAAVAIMRHSASMGKCILHIYSANAESEISPFHMIIVFFWGYVSQIAALSIFSCDQAALQMVFSVRLSVCPSVCPSVRPSHLFDYVPIILSSWNFQELLPVTEVTSMRKVKVRGQRSRSQRSQPNFTVCGL